MRHATNDELDGWFEVEERTDYAQQAIDEWRRDQKDPAPGVMPAVVFTGLDGWKVPDRR